MAKQRPGPRRDAIAEKQTELCCPESEELGNIAS